MYTFIIRPMLTCKLLQPEIWTILLPACYNTLRSNETEDKSLPNTDRFLLLLKMLQKRVPPPKDFDERNYTENGHPGLSNGSVRGIVQYCSPRQGRFRRDHTGLHHRNFLRLVVPVHRADEASGTRICEETVRIDA